MLESVLFVELIGGIGDLLMALPAMHALAHSHPEAHLHVFTFEAPAELVAHDPLVAVVHRTRRVVGVADRDLPARADLTALLSETHFDLIVSDTRYSGIHELIEASSATRKITQLWADAGRDELIEDLFLRRLQVEGVIDPHFAGEPGRVQLPDEERDYAGRWWRDSGLSPGSTVILNPHSGMPIKKWPTASFVTLGHDMVARGHEIAILAGERPGPVDELATLVPGSVVVPPVSILRLAAVLEHAAVVVSPDTGLAKLAAAVGAPVVGIYGPTWAGRYGQRPPHVNLQSPFACPELNPMNFTLQSCWYSGQCIFDGKVNCCEDVAPERVLEAVETLLRDRR